MIRLRRNREDIFFKTMQTSTVLVILITGYASSVRTEGMDPVDLEFLEPGQSHDDQRLPTFAETESDKKILDQLLSKERYDSRVIPPSEGPVVVNFSVHLLSLASPDESSLNYEVEFLMRQIWLDPRLRYEDGSHPFLNALHHHDEMWIPDTYFIKHGDFKEPSVPPYIALRVYRNGTVLYILRRHLILSCQGNLEIFPFDDPLCSFSVESISYEKSRMLYQWTDDEATLRKTPSLSSLNAYLMENSTTVCPDRFRWRGNISCLRVEMIFTRDKPFYLTSVFIPGIILVTSSFISFWLEWNAVGSRVLLGVTTMLNFFTTSNKFRSTLPVVSKLTAMNVWDGVCMCFIYASLLEFITVNYIGRKGPRQKFLIRQDTDIKMDRVSVEAFPDSEPEASLDSKANGFTTECQHEPSHPISIAKRIDIISRRVFPLCFAIFLIFFFIQYKAFG